MVDQISTLLTGKQLYMDGETHN